MPRWRDDPAKVRPMLASLDEVPLAVHGWVYEPKYDGIRALVDVQPAATRSSGGHARPHVALYSRNGNDKSTQFPALIDALAVLAGRIKKPVIFDGEIVAIDVRGRPLGFQQLQGRIHLTGEPDIARADRDQPAALVLFDVLRDGDDDVRGLSLAARRLRLQELVRPTAAMKSRIRLSEIVADDGRELMARAKREGWEGLIAKDGSSVYQSGRRTPAWRKLKLLNAQEFVIGGWTAPRETRSHFGALLLGYYDDAGRLQFAGSVGTGFDQAELTRLAALFEKRAIPKSPFAVPVKTAERAHWIRPDLVAEVRFTEWTSDGMLRHPVYLGSRDDKKGKEIKKEGSEGSQSSEGSKGSRTGTTGTTGTVVEQLLALEKAKKDGDVALPNGEKLRVTNLSKLFWPALGITKGELLRYYAEVAPLLLPVIDDRPLVMKRFPNGIDKQAFYQQHHPEAVPAGVRREALPEAFDAADSERGRERLIGGSLTTLLYMTQLAAISQDPWFSRVADPLHQDYAALDLDPGDGATFGQVLDVARWIKDELDRLGIPGLPKTSGASGLHIYIPLPKRTTYETGQLLCQVVATIVASAHPKVATIERMVKRRPRATVYVDYLQNILGKTIATAYSARASDYAGVSTPLSWQEVAEGVDPQDFTIRTAPQRFRDVGDLWKRMRTGNPVNLNAVLRKIRL